MSYFWAIIAVCIIFGIGFAIRAWNLPEVAKARSERAIEWQKQRTERLRIRRERNKEEELARLTFADKLKTRKRRWGILE